MTSEQIIKKLKSLANPKAIEGMKRFAVGGANTLGINIPTLRKMAKEIGKDHAVAIEIWESGIHEARILASMIDDPAQLSEKQMDKWVADFDSWDVCDQTMMNLFGKSPVAFKKAKEYQAKISSDIFSPEIIEAYNN